MENLISSVLFEVEKSDNALFTHITSVLFVLLRAEMAGITSAWLEKRQKRGMWMRGRARGQVRPESCLCVAAGSRNTALHCEVFAAHTCILYMLRSYGGMFWQKYEVEKPLQVCECNKKSLQSVSLQGEWVFQGNKVALFSFCFPPNLHFSS